MKVAIMQPYLFPYIGYFQLIGAVDQFVIHDDVKWIKGGWINRNRILVNGKPHYISLPVQNAPSSLNINQREFSVDVEKQKTKIIRQIENAYREAPHFDEVLPLVTRCFALQERNVAAFVTNTIRECCGYLGISATLVLSSQLEKNNQLKAEERVLDIIVKSRASHYFNPIGGTELYDKTHFSAKGVLLSFIEARPVQYRQMHGSTFIPFLSIIDVMMLNSKQQLSGLLGEYDLH